MSRAGLWDPPLSPTVDDFVTALANVRGYTTTEPKDVECCYRGQIMQHDETMDAMPAGTASPVVAAGDGRPGEA